MKVGVEGEVKVDKQISSRQAGAFRDPETQGEAQGKLLTYCININMRRGLNGLAMRE